MHCKLVDRSVCWEPHFLSYEWRWALRFWLCPLVCLPWAQKVGKTSAFAHCHSLCSSPCTAIAPDGPLAYLFFSSWLNGAAVMLGRPVYILKLTRWEVCHNTKRWLAFAQHTDRGWGGSWQRLLLTLQRCAQRSPLIMSVFTSPTNNDEHVFSVFMAIRGIQHLVLTMCPL